MTHEPSDKVPFYTPEEATVYDHADMYLYSGQDTLLLVEKSA